MIANRHLKEPYHRFAVAHLGEGEDSAPKRSAARERLAQHEHDERCPNDQARGLHIVHIYGKLWLTCSRAVVLHFHAKNRSL